MITTLLWDIDGTLLDFIAAEKAAIKKLFSEYNLGECSDEAIKRYSEINKAYWEKLERKELTKQEILIKRFEDFFAEQGVDTAIAPQFNEEYQIRLGDTIVFRDNGYEVVKSFCGKVKQYAVSNGTIRAQSRKLKLSGLGDLFDGIFLSEELGAEKPDIVFFEKVFEKIKPADKSQVMIIGDSLTSDIRGGNNAGILTCWYNPEHKPLQGDFKIDFEIENLNKIKQII